MAKMVQIPDHLAQCSVPCSDPEKSRMREGQADWIIFFLSASKYFQLRGFPGPGEASVFSNPREFYFKYLSTFPSSLFKLLASK